MRSAASARAVGRLGEAGDVAGEHVDLEVDPVALFRSFQLVTWSVCGMSRQSKRFPLTALTVSEVPSRATEPLARHEQRETVPGASNQNRVVSPRSSRSTIVATPST